MQSHSLRKPRFSASSPRGRLSGQALIESCLAIAIICLIFFGLLQVSQLFAAREVLFHAAARGARAKTVGFNRFMVSKSARVAAIPNSGRMVTPEYVNNDEQLRNMVATMRAGELWDATLRNWDDDLGDLTPSSQQGGIERARIPDYLGSHNWATARHILDYQYWEPGEPNGIDLSLSSGGTSNSLLHVSVRQRYPMWVPMHRTFYAPDDDAVSLEGVCSIEKHYDLYIDDYGW